MKRISVIVALLAMVMSVGAQVENRALRLTASGKVECGVLPEMNGIHSYTLQMWFKPTTWKSGATLIERGDLCVALGASAGKLKVTVNGEENEVTSNLIGTNWWQQLTLINSKGRVKVRVDNQEVGSFRVSDTGASMDSPLTIGEGFTGLVDEIRIWNTALKDTYDYFWNNTLNEFNQQVGNLLVYYKMDHEEWDGSLVDYKSIWKKGASNHHGVITGGTFVGVDRRSADKTHVNEKLPYLLNGGYTNNERFFDSGITREAYLMSNDIICLSILSWNNGHLDYFTPTSHGALEGTAVYAKSYKGRKGVLSLPDGEGCMRTPGGTLSNSTNYAIEGWFSLKSWVIGATLFKKGDFSIQFGKRSGAQLIINVGAEQFIYETKITTIDWFYLGISPSGTSFDVVVNDELATCVQQGKSSQLPQTDAECVFGEGMKGYMDDWAFWSTAFDASTMISHKDNLPMPSLGGRPGGIMQRVNSFYRFDDEANPGWDYYSQDEWLKIMKSAYDGYRGYQFRISVYSHDGWENTICDYSKRVAFAKDLGRLSVPYAGVELDLEWSYANNWETYGQLVDLIRDELPEGKTLMVSCHNVSYKFLPTNRIDKVDGFTMQQYGPQKTHYTYASCVNNYNGFINRYPKDKIYLSYATTTSCLYNDSEQNIGAIAGVNWGAMPPSYEPGEDMERYDRAGGHHYFMSPKQVYKRAKFAQDKACQGIFYWDMANDYRIDHKYMMSRMASYGLNANVDRIVTDGTPKNPEATGTKADDPDQSIPEVVEMKGNRIKSPSRLVDGAYVAMICGDEHFAGKSWMAGDKYAVSEDAEWAPLPAIYRLDEADGGCFYLYDMTRKQYIGHADSKSSRGDFYEVVWCDDASDAHISRMQFNMVDASGSLYLPETAAYMFNMVDKNHGTYPSLKVGDTEPNFGYTGTNSWKVWLMYEYDKETVEKAFGIETGVCAPSVGAASSAEIYDLTGRRVRTLGKGCYVIGGRKVVVK